MTGSTVLSGLTSTGNTLNNAEHKGLYIGSPKDEYENNEYSQLNIEKTVNPVQESNQITEDEDIGNKFEEETKEENSKIKEDLTSKEDTVNSEATNIVSTDKNLDSDEKNKESEDIDESSNDVNTNIESNLEKVKSKEDNSEISNDTSEDDK